MNINFLLPLWTELLSGILLSDISYLVFFTQQFLRGLMQQSSDYGWVSLTYKAHNLINIPTFVFLLRIEHCVFGIGASLTVRHQSERTCLI